MEKKTIKMIRIKMNMTQREFAKFVGMTFRNLQNVELGKRELKAKEMLNISNKCNVPLIEIEV